MKRKILLFLTCGILLAGSTFLSGCRNPSSGTDNDLMKDTPPGKSAEELRKAVDLKGEGAVAVTDFGTRLLQNTVTKGENTLISPLSVICALGMTNNGARTTTQEQMEQVLGMPCEELNAYLSAFIQALPAADQYKLSAANSIWIKEDEGLTVEPDFLQANADWYNAGIYEAPFDDSTVKRINQWVNENTDEMIPEILSEIPEDAVMYLVNALAFDAEWETIYDETQIYEDTFTAENGAEQTVDFMRSEEYRYLEDDHAVGFMKYYADEKYAFTALLPDSDTDINDYTASLTGEKIHHILSNPEDITVYAAMPKFSCEYGTKLKPVLETMGMPHAFDPEAADFSGLGAHTNGNIYINEVIHKTFITVDERGTKAGAAALVEMMAETALAETKSVTLNRPFIYMLVDCETNVPVFMGVIRNIEE